MPKNIILKSLSIICTLLIIKNSHLYAQELFNYDWKFVKKDVPGFETVTYDDNDWQEVNLPHSANIEPLIVNNQWQGICCYRKHFSLNEADTNKIAWIRFEAAMNIADVWINGKHMITHMGGYLPFTIDITDVVLFDRENVIVVRLDNRDNAITGPKPLKILDFCMYGGIYRDVHLYQKNRLHITDEILENKPASGGIFITYPQVSQQQATIKVKTHVRNSYREVCKFELRQSLYNLEGERLTSRSEQYQLTAAADKQFTQTLTVTDPKLWSPLAPNLYNIQSEIILNGRVVDSQSTRIGIREIKITAQGFWINGQKMYLRGTNRHQEYPYIGYALSNNAQYRDAKKIKDAGFDYIRLSHYPHSPAFMDACDELGLLVMDCIPGWQFYNATPEFEQLQYQRCRDMIRRDRNHPCVLLWEVSLNESDMPDYFRRKTHAIAHEEYPGEQCYTCGWQGDEYDVFIQARQHGGCHEVAGSPCVISEYGDWEYYAQNAGLKQDAWESLKKEERNSRQLRGCGEVRLLQQALNFQEAFNDNLSTPAFGDGIWVMYDYNRGYADDIEASGIMDIFRIPKFSYYFYQSQRDPNIELNNAQSGPMVYISNYWTATSPTDVRVFSNCEEVVLYLNNNFIEKRTPDRDRFSQQLPHPPFTFAMEKFEPGTLKAIGLIDDQEVSQNQVSTPGTASKINLEIDLSGKTLPAARNDVVFIYASIVDDRDVVIPDATDTITFQVNGPAKLIGQNPIAAEAGMIGILLRAEEQVGKIEITATSDSLASAYLEIISVQD